MRHFAGLFAAMLLVVGLVLPSALAQSYPPSPTPTVPTPSPRPGPGDPTPTERPGRPRPTTPAEGGTPPGPPVVIPSVNPAPGPGPVDPGVAPSSQQPAAGELITISGEGWMPNSAVEIFILSTPRLLARTTSDGQGRYRVSVRIPKDVEAGSHTLQASGVAPDGSPRTTSTPVQVLPAGTSSAGAIGDSTPGLVNTGIPMAAGLLLAGLLLAAGAAFLQLARRRAAVEAHATTAADD